MCTDLEWRRSYRADQKVHGFRPEAIRPFVAVQALCPHTVTNDQLGSPLQLSQLDLFNEVCPECLWLHAAELGEQVGEQDKWAKRDAGD